MRPPPIAPLYAILDVRGDWEAREEWFVRLQAAGVHWIQVRGKDASAADLVRFVRRLLRRKRRQTTIIVNDRVDVALATGAAGVHLGASDLPVSSARALGPDLIVGATIRSLGGARRAIRAGADYVALGPMARSRSKTVPARLRTIAQLKAVAREVHPVPVVAIGGIVPELAGRIYGAGAASIAVIGALSEPPNPARVVSAFARQRRAAMVDSGPRKC